VPVGLRKGKESLDFKRDIATFPAPENIRTPSESAAEPATILAVDDDEVSLQILRELLELHGYRVLVASEGTVGVELFEKERPQLVITDIRMPYMDGIEVLRRISEIDDAVPVILVTGHGDLENAIKALRRGAYDFLQKPINTEILLNTVSQGLEHYRLRRFERNYTRVLEAQVEERTWELARTNDFLKGILNSSTGVSIVLTDFDQTVLFWNTGAEKIFGYTSEEMIGSKISQLYVDEDKDTPNAAIKLFSAKQTGNGTVHSKIRQKAKDGRTLTISLAQSPMLDASGTVQGLLGLGQDVTEEVRLHEELVDSYQRIQRIQDSSIFALAKLAESRDGETGLHLKRIRKYCKVLCQQLRTHETYKDMLTDQFINDLVQSSILHDIGKVAIPDAILFNPNKFGVEEYETMKRHTIHGGQALEDAAIETGEQSFLSVARDIAYCHHEHWDGRGYPYGLKGDNIPLAARIVAIADVYDALTTARRYKRAFSREESRGIVMEQSGKQFDPDVVRVFAEVEEQFWRIRSNYSAEAEIDISGFFKSYSDNAVEPSSVRKR